MSWLAVLAFDSHFSLSLHSDHSFVFFFVQTVCALVKYIVDQSQRHHFWAVPFFAFVHHNTPQRFVYVTMLRKCWKSHFIINVDIASIFWLLMFAKCMCIFRQFWLFFLLISFLNCLPIISYRNTDLNLSNISS